MQQSDPRPAPTRGIIIADTSALLPLCVTLDKKFLTEKGKASRRDIRLVDMLGFLAQHGYEVIIPEMVAHECGSYMRDGHTANEHFTDYDVSPMMRLTGPYIGAIAAHPGNMYIAAPPANDQTAAAQYVRSAWKLHKSGMSQSEVIAGLIGLRQLYPDKAGFSDAAALQLVKTMRKASVPIFYLARNNTSLETVQNGAKGISVHRLSPGRLYENLQNEHLLEHLDISGHPFTEVLSRINESLAQQLPNYTYRPLAAGRVRQSSDGAEIIFRKTLKGLERELGRPAQESESAGAAGATDTAGPSAADKFAQRFGKIGTLKGRH